MEKALRAFQKTGTLNSATAIFIAYISCSILLSLSILTRLLFTVDITFKVLDIATYFGFFLVIPGLAVYWLTNETTRRGLSAKWLLPWIPYAVLLAFAFVIPSVPDYLFLWFPSVPLVVMLCAKSKSKSGSVFKRRTVVFVACGLAVALLLPNMAAFAGASNLLNQAASMNSDKEKASFISRRVIETTAFGWIPRADTDHWRFLLSGAGMCGEMATAGTNLFGATGLVARRVVLPGEDHVFIEVKIGGDWLVADPGYYGGELTTRAERAARRVADVGSVSYVVALTENSNSLVELTQQYVSTDTIIVRITRNGEPLADAQVVLKHRFGSLTTQLPCDGCEFHTSVNGTITLHLGKPYYINNFKGSEEYYWIYINGQNTGRNVTSTGTGLIQSLEIDLG
jgi:hypothetical protein